MAYLVESDLTTFGVTLTGDFETLYPVAERAVRLYTQDFYSRVDFETDIAYRKQLYQQALALQMAYLDKSGVLSVEDKRLLSHVNIGRTTITLQNGDSRAFSGGRYNLSADAENLLRMAGWGYCGVSYDR